MNWKCSDCKQELTLGVIEYSTKYFGRQLCVQCQDQERLSKVNPKFRKQLEVSLGGGEKI